MLQLKDIPQARLVRRCCGRQPLRVLSLHKALNKKPKLHLSSPEDVTFEFLTRLRRPNLYNLAVFLPPGVDLRGPASAIHVGPLTIQEEGPLARCSAIMDTASRRVLPGHLLRRCRILSSMQLGQVCQQRVALTACSGEESIFTWRLRRRPESVVVQPGSSDSDTDSGSDQESEAPANDVHSTRTRTRTSDPTGVRASDADTGRLPGEVGPSSSQEGAAGGQPQLVVPGGGVLCDWMLESVERDPSQDDEEMPSTPHPRCSPELVVKGLLAAVQRADLVAAARFMRLPRWLALTPSEQAEQLRAMLRQVAYHTLLTHSDACIVTSALPTQRSYVAVVQLSGGAGASLGRGSTNNFTWHLNMAANGCWYVQSIEVLQ